MPSEDPVMKEPLSRVQDLLDLGVSGRVSTEEFAARVKDLSTDELIDLSTRIVNLNRPEILS
jgi:hypothetical protein